MAAGLTVAVVGVTGAVGQTTLKLLDERKFPVKTLRVFASERSVGKTITFKDETLCIDKVGPEHAYLHDTGRAQYTSVTDIDALEAFHLLARTEGILPALESAHAVAYGLKIARQLPADQAIIINLSGRGDKDVSTVQSLAYGAER